MLLASTHDGNHNPDGLPNPTDHVTNTLTGGVPGADNGAGVHFDCHGRRLSTTCDAEQMGTEKRVDDLDPGIPCAKPNKRFGKWTFLEQMCERDRTVGGEAPIDQLKSVCKYHGWAWSLDVSPNVATNDGDVSPSFVCTVFVRGSILCRHEAASKWEAVKEAVVDAVAKLLELLCPKEGEAIVTPGKFLLPPPNADVPALPPAFRGKKASELEWNVLREVKKLIEKESLNGNREVAELQRLHRGECLVIALSHGTRVDGFQEGYVENDAVHEKSIQPIAVVAASDMKTAIPSKGKPSPSLLSFLRRAFHLYLLSEVKKFHEGSPSILWMDNATELLTVKCNFSLKIFAFPCSSVIETSDSIYRALEKWRHIGIQGALLSHMFRPQHFQSVVKSDLSLSDVVEEGCDMAAVQDGASLVFAWSKDGVSEFIEETIEQPTHDSGNTFPLAMSDDMISKLFRDILYEHDYAKYKRLYFDDGGDAGGFRKRIRRGVQQSRDRTYRELKAMAVDHQKRKEDWARCTIAQ